MPSTSARSGTTESCATAPHRQESGLQDVDTVDFFYAGLADADNGAATDFQVQPLALSQRQFLRIVDLARQYARDLARQDNSRRDHRSGQGPTPNLVDADDDTGERPFETAMGQAGLGHG